MSQIAWLVRARQLLARGLLSLKLRLLDLGDYLAGRRDPLVPPRRLVFVGEGDFRAVGDEFLGHLKNLAELQRESSLLDIGCGIGRIARPLTTFLSSDGNYEGFDVVKEGIEWCQNEISPRFPNFHFTLLDIRNEKYNPQGKLDPATLRFPAEDGRFDVVVATSVFTHMLAAEHGNYLAEAARALKPGGRLLATYFLLDGQGEGEQVTGRQPAFDFSVPVDGAIVVQGDSTVEAVAYRESEIRRLYASLGLTITEPIGYGSWSGRDDGRSFQDIVIARKTLDN